MNRANNFRGIAAALAAHGRGGDTELVHMTRGEVNSLHGLASLAGGGLTRNPHTGLTEANFLKQLLPTIAGIAAGVMTSNPYVGAAVAGAAEGARSGKWQNALAAAATAYGGVGAAGDVMKVGAAAGAGAGAAGTAAGTMAEPSLMTGMDAAGGGMGMTAGAGSSAGLASLDPQMMAVQQGGTAPQFGGSSAPWAAKAPTTYQPAYDFQTSMPANSTPAVAPEPTYSVSTQQGIGALPEAASQPAQPMSKWEQFTKGIDNKGLDKIESQYRYAGLGGGMMYGQALGSEAQKEAEAAARREEDEKEAERKRRFARVATLARMVNSGQMRPGMFPV